jgi:hypothetical protein
MNYLRVSVLLIVLAAILIAGCTPAATPPPTDIPPTPTEEPQAQWEEILQKRVEQPVRMAAFFDETFGVTGGESRVVGRAHYTIDGGQTWTPADKNSSG